MTFDLRRVPRRITEQAEGSIHATYREHLSIEFSPRERPGRILYSEHGLSVSDAFSATREACLFRFVAIVESYVDALFVELVEERAPIDNDLVYRLSRVIVSQSENSWDARKAALADYFDIFIGEIQGWSKFDAAIFVRNSIAHGLGRVTGRQRAKDFSESLQQIGAAHRDGRIIITEGTLETCRCVCVDVIHQIDVLARTEA